MPDYLEMLRGLLGAFGPRAAEAKVVARDPETQALMDAMRTGETLPVEVEPDDLRGGRFDPVKKGVYREVLARAQERPETVSMGFDLAPESERRRVAGMYYPGQERIDIRNYPNMPVMSTRHMYQDTASHELLHFLLQHMAPEMIARSPQRQPSITAMLGSERPDHALIRFLQGEALNTIEKKWDQQRRPFMVLPVTTNTEQRAVVEEAMRAILKDPALLEQALRGLRPQEVR